MKRISYFIFTLLSILGIALQSCTDEIQYPDGRDEQPMRKGITLRIPDPKGMTVTNTRALKNGLLDLADKEGTITSLYLIAFSGDDEIPVIKEPLTGENDYNDADHPNTAKGQREFDLTEIFKEAAKKEATWKVYVAANIDAYLPDGKTLATTTIKKESDLTGIKLNFFKTVDGKEKYLLDPALIEENGL
ncbi:MAG: hypothetical protein K2H76_08690, partial [Muribaculaceae bacterium]|nr:hypothetical protein [Muribaculaceae bacterium]